MKITATQQQTHPLNSEYQSNDFRREMDSLGGVPIRETDNLDETVLSAASMGNPDRQPPEIARGTEDIMEWDQPAGESGTWTPRAGSDDGISDAERLVETGIDEADRERRLAAGDSED